MENLVSGINEDKLDVLALSIYDTVDKLKEDFNLLEQLVNSSTDFYKSSDADILRNKFNDIFNELPNMYSNISSYANDLVKVKHSYSDDDQELKSVVDNFEIM